MSRNDEEKALFDIKVDSVPGGVKVTLVDGRPLVDFTIAPKEAERFADLLRAKAAESVR